MRFLLIAFVGLSLTACNLVFKLPTRQGNVIEQKQIDQVKPGMTRAQVTYLMGTPIAASPFRSDRWDYIGYYKSPRDKISNRTVTIFFENDVVSRLEGAGVPESADGGSPRTPSASAIFKQQKKEQNEDTRSDGPQGPEEPLVPTQPSNTP